MDMEGFWLCDKFRIRAVSGHQPDEWQSHSEGNNQIIFGGRIGFRYFQAAPKVKFVLWFFLK